MIDQLYSRSVGIVHEIAPESWYRDEGHEFQDDCELLLYMCGERETAANRLLVAIEYCKFNVENYFRFYNVISKNAENAHKFHSLDIPASGTTVESRWRFIEFIVADFSRAFI